MMLVGMCMFGNSGSPAAVGALGKISIIKIKTNKVVGVITGFDGPGAIVISGDTARICD